MGLKGEERQVERRRRRMAKPKYLPRLTDCRPNQKKENR